MRKLLRRGFIVVTLAAAFLLTLAVGIASAGFRWT
jgi:hypothetical protein